MRDAQIEGGEHHLAASAPAGVSWPKLCQRPSEIAGSLQAALAAAGESMRS